MFLDKESDSDVHFGVASFFKKFDGPCNISMTSYGSLDREFENMRRWKFDQCRFYEPKVCKVCSNFSKNNGPKKIL